MIFFFIYFVLFFICLYKYSYSSFVSKSTIVILFSLKAIFIFFISYFYTRLYPPDEDNYFHDAVLFSNLAKQYVFHYLQFLVDIETNTSEVFDKYYSFTNAWYKVPSFFYNDNRWVIKIHSLLALISGQQLSVHRLFSAYISIVGLLLTLNFIFKILKTDKISVPKLKSSNRIFLVASISPFFFLFTSFVLKESIMIFYTGILLHVLYQWIMENNFTKINTFTGLFFILTSFLFRPTYLLPLIYFTGIFLFIQKNIPKYKVQIFLSVILGSIMIFIPIFKLACNKSLLDIIQYRQERFLDTSNGGIFLLSTKKFVRVPYNWNYLNCDSTQKIPKFYIKKNVPLMYWYLTNLNDTIIEQNTDTVEQYHLLYYIEKANSTVYIQTINSQKSIFHNIQSLLQSIEVFFFYPNKIRKTADIIVWIENILILTMISILIYHGMRKHDALSVYYILLFIGYIIVMISISSPNIGAIARYRCFILPFLFITVTTIYSYHDAKWIKTRMKLLITSLRRAFF